MKMKKTYIIPLAEVVDLGLKENILVDGTHSVEDYKEKSWTNIGTDDEDNEVIPCNQTSLWDE